MELERCSRHGVTPAVSRSLTKADREPEEDAVNRFLHRHAGKVMGVLSGFDRLVLRGTLRRLSYVAGMMGWLAGKRVLLKDFGDFAQGMTEGVKAAVVAEAEELGRPIVYLPSSRIRKDERAREIAARDGIEEGLIAVLSCVEPCMSYEIYRNRTRSGSSCGLASASASTTTSTGSIRSSALWVRASRPGSPSRSRSRSTGASGWRGGWTRPASSTCVATTASCGSPTSSAPNE